MSARITAWTKQKAKGSTWPRKVMRSRGIRWREHAENLLPVRLISARRTVSKGRLPVKRDEDRWWEDTWSDMVYWKFEGIPQHSSVLSAVGFMERTLKLTKGARVLDLGCALGYHAIELARLGYEVTGLEWSQTFLEVARRKVAEVSASVRLIHGDMTRMTFDREFDAVVLWGNTFGMFSDEDNLATLCGIKRALVNGGLALIDTQNYATLPEKLENGWDFHHKDKNLLLLTEGTKDALKARFGFNVAAIDLATGKRHKMPFSWRLYLLPELKRLVKDAGLKLVGIYGDDPRIADWKNWKDGEPYPYCVDGFTEKAGKRILLCQV